MTQPTNRLVVLADALLEAVVDGFTAEGRPLPDKRLVAPGTAAGLPFDCELLAVNLERTFGHDGNVAGEAVNPLLAQAGFAIRGVSANITLVRCCATVTGAGLGRTKLPSTAAEEADAHSILIDAMVMTNAVLDAARNSALRTSCNGVALENWRAVGPDGGFGGGILSVRLSLL